MGPICKHCRRYCNAVRVIGDMDSWGSDRPWRGYMPTCAAGRAYTRAQVGEDAESADVDPARVLTFSHA